MSCACPRAGVALNEGRRSNVTRATPSRIEANLIQRPSHQWPDTNEYAETPSEDLHHHRARCGCGHPLLSWAVGLVSSGEMGHVNRRVSTRCLVPGQPVSRKMRSVAGWHFVTGLRAARVPCADSILACLDGCEPGAVARGARSVAARHDVWRRRTVCLESASRHPHRRCQSVSRSSGAGIDGYVGDSRLTCVLRRDRRRVLVGSRSQ